MVETEMKGKMKFWMKECIKTNINMNKHISVYLFDLETYLIKRGIFRESKISRFRDFFNNLQNLKMSYASIREIKFSRNCSFLGIREIKFS